MTKETTMYRRNELRLALHEAVKFPVDMQDRSVQKALTDIKDEISRIIGRHFARNGKMNPVVAPVGPTEFGAPPRPIRPEDVTPETLGRGVNMVTIFKVWNGEEIEMQADRDRLTVAIADGWQVRKAKTRPVPTPKEAATAPARPQDIPTFQDLDFLKDVASEIRADLADQPSAQPSPEPENEHDLGAWMRRYIPETFAGKQVRKSGGAKTIIGEVPIAYLHKAALAAGFDLECQTRPDKKKPCRGALRDCPVRLQRRLLAQLPDFPLRIEAKQHSCWGNKYVYGT